MRMDIATHRADIEAWLILLRAPQLSASRLRELIARHASAAHALAAMRAGEAVEHAATRAWLRAPDHDAIARDLDWLAGASHRLVTIDSADFPALLRDAPGAPAALFVAGNADALWQPQIAIVGSRNASHGGLANARSFARALGAAGFAIASGLAEGIDAAAHEAALDAGAPTIAVLGTGPDLVYPLRHRGLAARIAAPGALVSEFAPGMPGRPENFPRRNRIIAGLALGTLVVEAGLKSGSLITARHAIEQGRDVFAIPGSIHNPVARGCHRLIRDGAMLVESADEIIDALAPLAARLGAHLRDRLDAASTEALRPAPVQRDGDYVRLLEALGPDEALGIDVLAGRTGLPAAALSSMLLVLELEGEVAAGQGGVYVRRSIEM
ncbi:MAG TPA: DNA-processing protein DprA [Rhodanobacteraceae bacterium]|nr:DNA-processing protein DprA [Rhodanobacteraceae bacterium]